MLDEKRIKESKNRVEDLLKKGDIVKENTGKYVDFFLNNSKNSFFVLTHIHPSLLK